MTTIAFLSVPSVAAKKRPIVVVSKYVVALTALSTPWKAFSIVSLSDLRKLSILFSVSSCFCMNLVFRKFIVLSSSVAASSMLRCLLVNSTIAPISGYRSKKYADDCLDSAPFVPIVETMSMRRYTFDCVWLKKLCAIPADLVFTVKLLLSALSLSFSLVK